MERRKKKKKKEEKSREALMQSGDGLQLLSGSDTNKKRQEAEMKRRASALGVTRIRDEDVTGTAVHAKCLEIKPERPDSEMVWTASVRVEGHWGRKVAGKRPGGGAERRLVGADRGERTRSRTDRCEKRSERRGAGRRWRQMVGFCHR